MDPDNEVPAIKDGRNDKQRLPNGAAAVFVSFHTSKSGILYSIYTEEGFPFDDLRDLLRQLNCLCDTIGFPRSAAVLHGGEKKDTPADRPDRAGFFPKPVCPEQEIWQKCAGQKTNIIEIRCRQDESLRGSVYFSKEKIDFNSDLQLLHILTTGGNDESEHKF